jgi:hypothetical protein
MTGTTAAPMVQRCLEVVGTRRTGLSFLMLELLLCFAVATGIERARRARHRVALLGGGVVAYLIVADTLCAVAGNRGDQQIFSLFNYLFIGPGAAALRSDAALPLPSIALDHPWLVRVTRSLLCGGISWHVLRESSRLNPLLPRAYALDALAMPFVGAAIIDAVELIVLVFAATLAARA